MKCFSMQRPKKRYNGAAECTVSAEGKTYVDIEEECTPPMPSSSAPSTLSSSSLSTRPSFRSRVRAIQNAQRFIENNRKLRSSHPSYGSRERRKDASDASPTLLALGGRARSTTEPSSGSFVEHSLVEATPGYHQSGKHLESTAAAIRSSISVEVKYETMVFPQPLPHPLQGPSEIFQKAPQLCNAYRLPLPSESGRTVPCRSALPTRNCPKAGTLHNASARSSSPLAVSSKHMRSLSSSVATNSSGNGMQDDILSMSSLQSNRPRRGCDHVTSPINPATTTPDWPTSELQPLPPPGRDVNVHPDLRFFTYDELSCACQNFSLDRHVHGTNMCFNGTISVKGHWKGGKHQDVIVLVLKEPHPQGFQEWTSKLFKLAMVEHEVQYVCKLVGVYGEESSAERMLAYERLKLGTLSCLLFEASDNPPLDWVSRMKIAFGAAQGLATLHEKFPNMVLYEDFQTSNVQVDDDYSSKVALYKVVDLPDVEIQSTSNDPNINAYRAPESVSRGELTAKSHIWSFGIVLLELLSGKQHMDRGMLRNEKLNIVKWATPFLVDEAKLFLLMDPKLEGEFPARGAKKIADLALACLQKDPLKRPIMREILNVLREVHESTYAVRTTRITESIVASSKASCPAASAWVPISPPFSSIIADKQRIQSQEAFCKADFVKSPSMRPLVVPHCAGERVTRHHHDSFSPAPLAHVKF
ncbi:hypothetical protein KP509_23G001200 [Ceratopteris richardii]|uniref:Protein kinase domain-containing protein n=1 Tax=Ceratopteris richardii TaxID=49495 RepID=A0A8T2RZH5_CERRI|nr:hypothetical protein KP509_23G001200 [Ceratopteris richardii]